MRHEFGLEVSDILADDDSFVVGINLVGVIPLVSSGASGAAEGGFDLAQVVLIVRGDLLKFLSESSYAGHAVDKLKVTLLFVV